MSLRSPGISSLVLRFIPRHIRDDAVQEAWLAFAEGRKPDSAVRALLRHEERHRATKPNLDKIAVRSVRRRF